MSYDQHTQGTTPGPTADIRWVEATIKHTLKFIPANKVSLGIPLYSGHWFTGKISAKSAGIKVHLEELAYPDTLALIKRNHINTKWDDASQTHYAVYERHWLYQYLFIEDAKSFAAKVTLAKKYHLRGISVFDLGIEDPDIWKNVVFQ
jgi:spore germination protein